MDLSLGDRLYVMLAYYAGEYRLPYVETEAEHKYLSVLLKGRAGTDTWIITDGGSDYYRWSRDEFSMGYESGETREDFYADTRRPLAEAFAKAEVIAAEMRVEAGIRMAHAVRRYEAEQARKAKAHP